MAVYRKIDGNVFERDRCHSRYQLYPIRDPAAKPGIDRQGEPPTQQGSEKDDGPVQKRRRLAQERAADDVDVVKQRIEIDEYPADGAAGKLAGTPEDGS